MRNFALLRSPSQSLRCVVSVVQPPVRSAAPLKHTHKLRRKTRSRGGEKKKKKRRRRRVYSQNESATQQSSDGRIDRSIHRLIDRQSVSGGEGGCELWVKQAGEKKEEKHESAAAAAVPGSGFNGLPQQRGTVAEPWPACPRVSVSPGPRGPRAQVGHECVCVCVCVCVTL